MARAKEGKKIRLPCMSDKPLKPGPNATAYEWECYHFMIRNRAWAKAMVRARRGV